MTGTAMSAQAILEKLAGLAKDVNDVLQDPFFESWAIQRRQVMMGKLAARASAEIGTVFVGHHLQHARATNDRREFVHLAEDFLADPPAQLPKNSVFLLLNNDIGKHLPQYIAYYNAHPEALFIVWDWDSQHWIYMSSALAMHSDIYVPASSENIHLLAQFNPFTVGPVFAAAHQWSRRFLADHAGLFLAERSREPLGMHVFYENYPRRNRAIATVAQTFPTVGFATNAFKGRSDLDNLKEWAAHKTHWIVPVLAGVPIRIYNALVTGGIPILPSFYKNLPEIAILGSLPAYYQVADLLQAAAVNDEAVSRFEAGGESALLARLADATLHHHIDARSEQLLLAVEDMLAGALRADTSHRLGYIGARL